VSFCEAREARDAQLATHSYEFQDQANLSPGVEVDQTQSKRIRTKSMDEPSDTGLCAGRPCISYLVKSGQTMTAMFGNKSMSTTPKGGSHREEARRSSQRWSLPVDATVFPHSSIPTFQLSKHKSTCTDFSMGSAQ